MRSPRDAAPERAPAPTRGGIARVERTQRDASKPERTTPAAPISDETLRRARYNRTLVGDLAGTAAAPTLVGSGATSERTPSRPVGDYLTGDTLGGVQLAPTPSGGGSVVTTANRTFIDNSTTIINNRTTIDNSVNYITNVGHANTVWTTPGCAPVWGPGSCWQSWNCSSGFSLGIGFGSGSFSFGLFFGSCNQPFVSNWCNPWWDGWSSWVSVGCAPSWRWSRACWSPCGGPWWSGWAGPSCWPAHCAPVFAWTPVWVLPSTTVVQTFVEVPTPVYTPVAVPVTTTVYDALPAVPSPAFALPTPSPSAFVAAEAQAWDLLADGFPRSAAESFAELHDAQPGAQRPLVGYALALAMLEDLPAAAGVLREAIATDPSILATIPTSPSLLERLRLLERSAEIASRQAGAARDALFLLAATRAVLGRTAEAHFAIIAAQQQGDQSLAAARLREWLQPRLGSV